MAQTGREAVSASAEGVVIVDPEADSSRSGVLGEGDYLVQPFIDELAEVGEMDLIYLGDRLSHAVRRGPHHSGATPIHLDDLPVAVADVAARVLEVIPERPVYARIDLVVHRGVPRLMEVELIEPELFLTLAPHSATKLAEVVLAELAMPLAG
jgi:hypothetical protein